MASATKIWQGSQDLARELRPVADLTPHPENPWRGDIDEIAKSLDRFGQVRPVLLDDNDVIIAGNHTYLAAVSLGWTHIAAIPNTFENAEEARAYLLADNRLAEVGDYDRAELTALLAEIEKSGGAWDGTGYTGDDLDMMRRLDALAAAPPLEAPPPPPPALPAAATDFREVVLMFPEEDAEAFTRFGGHVKILRHEYGTEGVTETVLRAVREEAVRLNQGDGP